MHPVLGDLALGYLLEPELRIAGERGPLFELALDELVTFQRSRPKLANTMRIVCIEDDREERKAHPMTVLVPNVQVKRV
jgi:hypothetical protein